MSFNWNDYFTFAKCLKEELEPIFGHIEEARLRNIASRSYYAAFNLARDFITKGEDDPLYSGSDCHRKIQDYFLNNISDKSARKIGHQLITLHKYRKQADYQRNMNEPAKNIAAKAYAEARKIIEEINSLR